MAISFGKPKENDVVSLIAAKEYARAIEILKAQLRRRGAVPSLRMQLADVLILADKTKEAIALLLPLADDYANEGFAAKAVSVLKKIQKLDPRRRDVDARLAQLIQEKQREAVALPSAARTVGGAETGIEEGPALEIGLDAMAPISTPAGAMPRSEDPDRTLPVREPSEPSFARAPALAPDEAPPVLGASMETEPVDAPKPAAAVEPKSDLPIEDYDLLYLGDGTDEVDEPVEPPAAEPPPEGPPMSAGQFADELISLVDDLFRESPSPAITPASAAAQPSRSQIVVSPLFRDFSVDEMVAVIAGLKLLSFGRGEVILHEGAPGTSLYMLTSGRVRAFRKNPKTGKQDPLADLEEGAFFGELSLLTGQPRSASIVALARCELLELDRPTLDEITKTHPHVWDVLRESAGKRATAQRG